jgi:hypothetical protein
MEQLACRPWAASPCARRCRWQRVGHCAALRQPPRRRAGRAESVGGHVAHLRCEREGRSGRIVAVHPQLAADGLRLQPLAQVTIVESGSPRKGISPRHTYAIGRGRAVGPGCPNGILAEPSPSPEDRGYTAAATSHARRQYWHGL